MTSKGYSIEAHGKTYDIRPGIVLPGDGVTVLPCQPPILLVQHDLETYSLVDLETMQEIEFKWAAVPWKPGQINLDD